MSHFAFPKESHLRIAAAYQCAQNRVKKIEDAGAAASADDRVLNWVDFVETHADIVAIFVPSHQNAYTLFETLNDRGLELSKSDLIKNYLYGRAGNRLDDVRKRWDEMIGMLETVGEKNISVTYIRHYWMATESPTRHQNLYRDVKAKYKTKGSVRVCRQDTGRNPGYALLAGSGSRWIMTAGIKRGSPP